MASTEEQLSTFKDRVVGRNIKENTYDMYEIWIRRYEMWRPGDEPGIGHLYDFDTLLADETVTDYPWENSAGRPAPDEYAYRSRRQALSAIKMWLRLNYETVVSEEVQNIVSGEPAPFDPPYISRDDAAGVIENAGNDCNNPDCEAMLALTYDCILRAAELAQLSREDIDLDAGTVWVNTVKGGQQSTLALGERAQRLLRRHLQQKDPNAILFSNTYDNGWQPSAWCSHFRRNHHEVGAHSFGRHTPIMHRLQNPDAFDDMDNEKNVFGQVYRRSRHQHPSMTNRYARLVGVDVPDWADQ